ncbi:MAG: polysaccharide biosynthesis tyrosine autokinase [Chloroflexi bacterium]|nr:polysaccharide biosynthesis tyrosine autokinase [Chloroflexota bacterium]
MEDQGLELREYWRILLKWWWVLVLGLVGTASAAYFVSGTITPTYQATTKVLVQGGQTPGTPFIPEVGASRDLALTYRDLIKTRPILEQVSQNESIPHGIGLLNSEISVSSQRSVIQISVSDPNPTLAAEIANTTAAVFIDDFRNRQFSEIAQLQAALSARGFVDDPSIIAAQAATLSTLSIVEEAVPALYPSSPRTKLNVIMGAALGLLSASVAVFFLQYLDDRLKSPNDIRRLTGMTSLISINRYQSRDDGGPTILNEDNRFGVLAESFKFLAINLKFASDEQEGLRSLVVTSSVPGEGKTTTSVNLAVSLAGMGKSVILVDADLRKPDLHQIFSMPNEIGMTQILDQTSPIEEALHKTSVEGLQIITSGATPMDPTPLMQSSKMADVIKELVNQADIVVIDSPPLLNVTDTVLLAPSADGVLFVVDSYNTSRSTLRQAVETLQLADVTAVGAVLNKVASDSPGYYRYYNSNYSGYSNYLAHSKNGASRKSSFRDNKIFNLLRRR